MIRIELCADAESPFLVDNLKLASALGVQRIELCAAMSRQGLTPAQSAIEMARKAFPDGELLIMIRPHDDGFSYSHSELDAMAVAIAQAAESGADGAVFGALGDDAMPNADANTLLVSCAKTHNLKSTFHRAFDATANPESALEALIAQGFDRVLSSGTDWGTGKGAIDGAQRLKRLYQNAQQRIELVVGGGVTPDNAQLLLDAIGPFSDSFFREPDATLSFHCFSSVLTNGEIVAEKLFPLLNLCRGCVQ